MTTKISSVDRKLKAQGYIKTTESEVGAMYVKNEKFGVSELRVFRTSDDILTESMFTLVCGTDCRKVPYAISYKTLKLIDRKIREMRKTYNWSMDDDNSRSRNTDTQ